MYYLTDNQILELVREYLTESSYHYAVMINGGWGSGKTHFVKKVLIPQLEKMNIAKKAVYVSLYGLKTNESLTSSILMSIAEKAIDVEAIDEPKKRFPWLRPGIKAAAEAVDNKLECINLLSAVKSVYSSVIDYKNYYFVFDDLERCAMPVNEMLGYINHFVEHNEAKVLLIANEKEMGSCVEPSEDMMRKFIAMQSAIDWPVKKKAKGLLEVAKPGVDAKINLETLKYRESLLVEDDKTYLHIKEKLVGQTIYYKPDLRQIASTISTAPFVSFQPEMKKELLDVICTNMEKSEHYNFRTLQFALAFFSKLRKTYPPVTEHLKEYEKLFLALLQDIICISIRCKNGEKEYCWAAKSEFGEISFSGNVFSSYFLSFKFVHEYVYHSEYDAMRIKTVLNEGLLEFVSQSERGVDPLYTLYYWEMEDVEITQGLEVLFQNLESGKYAGSDYKKILALLYKLKEFELNEIPIQDYITIMEQNIKNGTSINTLSLVNISKEDKYWSEYLDAVQKLGELEKSLQQTKKQEDINAIFSLSNGWGEKVLEYYREKKTEILTQDGFFKSIDVSLCYRAIIGGNVKDISDFRCTVNSVYDFRMLKNIIVVMRKTLIYCMSCCQLRLQGR